MKRIVRNGKKKKRNRKRGKKQRNCVEIKTDEICGKKGRSIKGEKEQERRRIRTLKQKTKNIGETK
jgi:hypothetical protein